MPTDKHPSTLSVTVAVASTITGLSQMKVRDAINRGALPAKREGVNILIRYRDLEAYIDGLPSVVDVA